MKRNQTLEKRTKAIPGKPVHVEFRHATAKSISIAGTFNAWRPEATPMLPSGDGRWVKELDLPPGVYEYRLVVDGAWMPDPNCPKSVPNPYNETNSVLTVTAGT